MNAKCEISELVKDDVVTTPYRGLITWVIIVLVLVVSAYVINFYLVHGFSFSSNSGDWGAFGDYVGGLINPAIGFAGLILLLKTLTQNSEMLKATKVELSLSTKELKNSSAALKAQEIQMRDQQKISLILSICEKIDARLSEVYHEGVRNNVTTFRQAIEGLNYNVDMETGLDLSGTLDPVMENFPEINHYILVLMNTVSEASTPEENTRYKTMIAQIIGHQVIQAMNITLKSKFLDLDTSEMLQPYADISRFFTECIIRHDNTNSIYVD